MAGATLLDSYWLLLLAVVYSSIFDTPLDGRPLDRRPRPNALVLSMVFCGPGYRCDM